MIQEIFEIVQRV